MKTANVQVIESARPPQRPYKPVVLLNMAFGLFSGLSIGAAVVIQRARASIFHEPGETALQLNVPELGVIPATTLLKPSYMRRLLSDSATTASAQEAGLVLAHNKTPSALTESFRLTLASILLSSNDGVQPRVIAFSSANAREGKTTVASNLGMVLAGFNRRVLLVDGDLRKRRPHRLVEVGNTSGLYEGLIGSSIRCAKE